VIWVWFTIVLTTLLLDLLLEEHILKHLVAVKVYKVYRSTLFSNCGFDCFDRLRTEEHARFIMQNSLSVA